MGQWLNWNFIFGYLRKDANWMLTMDCIGLKGFVWKFGLYVQGWNITQ